jgi:uncharacterized protein (TIRG00374 family)
MKGDGLARQRLTKVVKLAIAVALIVALFRYDVITLEALRVTFRDVPVATYAFVVLLIGYVLSMLRWYALLHAIGISIGIRPCAEIFAMGTFANTFLPGGTGGDLVRAVYIARHMRSDGHSDRTGGVISVVADRVMGLLGVLALAVVLGIADFERVANSPITRPFFLVVVGSFVVLATGILGTLVLMTPARFSKIKEFLGTRTRLHRMAIRALEIALELRSNPATALLSLFLSILVTLTIVLATILLSKGYEAGGLGRLDFASATVFALLANAVPITPGGIGVAEGAFAFLCYAWEPTATHLAYGTIFFSYRLILTVISLFGSVAFVTYSHDPVHSTGPSKWRPTV